MEIALSPSVANAVCEPLKMVVSNNSYRPDSQPTSYVGARILSAYV